MTLPEPVAFIPLYLATPLLVLMAFQDLSRLKISNRLVLAMVAIFVVSAPVFLPFQEIGSRFVAAGVIFTLGFAGFALRLWGGGDVKALAALALFLPNELLSLYTWTFVAAMAAGMLLVVSLRTVLKNPEHSWSSLQPSAGYPMGLSIALSGIGLPLAAMIFS